MESTRNNLKVLALAGGLITALAFAALPLVVQAASLYFSPSSGLYSVGGTFTTNVYVESAAQAMNAASGVISFDSDKLEIVSLSKTGSIVSLWVQEPSFSNAVGTANFEGIVLNPGFTGAGGKIIGVTFRVKTAGTANLTLSSGSVLANDGQGTNILTSLGTASFSAGLTGPAAPETTTPGEAVGAPAAPQIVSPTHPDPNKWYAGKDAKFTWDLPSGVTGTRLLIGKIPTALPTVTYVPPISSKEVPGLDDGVWYFHARLRNASGWGAVTHFRLQIDTRPPEPFGIRFVDGKETDNPRPTAVFDTGDELSGVDHYKVKIGEGDFFDLNVDTVKSNPYTLPLQAPGKRTILVQAFDRAGNYTVATEEFVIKPLETPVVLEYPRELQPEETLIVRGKTAYPDGQITMWLQREGKESKSFTVRPEEDGRFVVVLSEKLAGGVYEVWAEVSDERGAKSYPTEKLTVAVKQTKLIQIGSFALSIAVILVPLLALILILLLTVWYIWRRFVTLRKHLGREVSEVETTLHKAFNALRQSIKEQIKILEKARGRRELTMEEQKLILQLKKDLDNAERTVLREVRDIEKEVE